MTTKQGWKIPPRIKVYEALGCIADGRIRVDGNKAEVDSSDRSKTYTVNYDPQTNAIMANDNGSYWQGYLGYPAIALFMQKNILPFSQATANLLKGIEWKKLNTQYNNNYEKTEASVLVGLASDADRKTVVKTVEEILNAINMLGINRLGSRLRPPK